MRQADRNELARNLGRLMGRLDPTITPDQALALDLGFVEDLARCLDAYRPRPRPPWPLELPTEVAVMRELVRKHDLSGASERRREPLLEPHEQAQVRTWGRWVAAVTMVEEENRGLLETLLWAVRVLERCAAKGATREAERATRLRAWIAKQWDLADLPADPQLDRDYCRSVTRDRTTLPEQWRDLR